ncbi:MAG: hypothetical protein ACI8X5_002182 [Planctomycetota bacterium]|jgi:hypothetical protein
MLPFVLTCILSLVPTNLDRDVAKPSQKLVDTAVKSLAAAYKKDSPEMLVQAIADSGRIADPSVIRATSRALRDKNESVQFAAIEALRFNPHRSALSFLHMEFVRAGKSSEETAVLIRGVCQKGQVGSLPLFALDRVDTGSRETASAWILGLGRLRHRDSAEALISLMRALPASRRVVHMDEFRTSLLLLTGNDHGTDSAAWIRWWSENGDTLAVSTELPSAPGMMKQEWCDYWSITTEGPRPEQYDLGPLPELEVVEKAPAKKARKDKRAAPNGKAGGKNKAEGKDKTRAGAKPPRKQESGPGKKAKGEGGSDAAPKKKAGATKGAPNTGKAGAKPKGKKGAGKQG